MKLQLTLSLTALHPINLKRVAETVLDTIILYKESIYIYIYIYTSVVFGIHQVSELGKGKRLYR
jgi:hypothetical protein